MLEFFAIPYSPWSEKARWALDHHQVPYREHAYQSPIGEPLLRLRLRKWHGKVSVPVLFDGRESYADSFTIAEYAESVGNGAPLFGAARLERIRSFNEMSERALSAGRALALARVLDDDDALQELLPKPLRGWSGTAGRCVAAWGVKRVLRKYDAVDGTLERHERQLTSVLDEVRATLDAVKPAPGGLRYILGAFSYADIAASQVLQFVSPVKTGSFRIGRANRFAFGSEALSLRYRDLLAWRDELYAKHR